MAFMNFTKITPPAPNDPTVNEVTQLNNNWDHVNSKLDKMQTSPGVIDLGANPVANGVETGQEIILNDRIQLYNGSAWTFPVNAYGSWSAWTNIPLSASVAARPGFTPKYRTNSALRMGELTGCLLKDAGAGAWTHNADVIASNAVGQPIAGFSPVVPFGYVTGASTPTTPSTQTAAGRAFLSNADGWRLTVAFRGSSGGGNFICLDNVRWYY